MESFDLTLTQLVIGYTKWKSEVIVKYCEKMTGKECDFAWFP